MCRLYSKVLVLLLVFDRIESHRSLTLERRGLALALASADTNGKRDMRHGSCHGLQADHTSGALGQFEQLHVPRLSTHLALLLTRHELIHFIHLRDGSPCLKEAQLQILLDLATTCADGPRADIRP